MTTPVNPQLESLNNEIRIDKKTIYITGSITLVAILILVAISRIQPPATGMSSFYAMRLMGLLAVPVAIGGGGLFVKYIDKLRTDLQKRDLLTKSP